MKYTFVGDIHGKVDAVEHALSMDGQVVFVGDFMDSFDRSPEDHRKCLELVLGAIEAGKARATYGNHELSYIIPQHRCSGFDRVHQDIMRSMEARIEAELEPFILLSPDLLVSHAGLTNQIWKRRKLAAVAKRGELAAVLHGWWKEQRSPMHWIGMRRGGLDSVGGMFWCDFNTEFQPVRGLRQVFGHTQRGGDVGIRRVGPKGSDSYCIDCLDSPGQERTFLCMEV